MSTHHSAAELAIVHPDASGIDIGAQFHIAAVASERDEQPLRSFRSFTQDLQALASQLAQVGIPTVAMESTGVYWNHAGLKRSWSMHGRRKVCPVEKRM